MIKTETGERFAALVLAFLAEPRPAHAARR